ncbi:MULTISPECIES: hypothetical protein [Actinomadura]|uniref:Uncharacterized protein n=1 Tax=Actinomadura yumaensis TaxID=111807 RepID=A0ABW2D0V0_9ACTN|nr:hypothetical protein [Actinomadura sp. J1-007]MWK36377.1 hypothetical protein [Actinomadura sp. J1-007]
MDTERDIGEVKAELGREFPGWRFIVSDRRRWWALRGPLPPELVNEVDVVDADTAEQLRALLGEVRTGGRSSRW